MLEYETLVAELHSALAHLDDPPYLEKHSLAELVTSGSDTPGLSRGQALRRAMRLAIAALDPGAGNGAAGLEARSYQVLYRWAVTKQGMVAIASSLGISERQAYRELRRAVEALAQILSSAFLLPGQPAEPAGRQNGKSSAAHLQEELARLSLITDQYLDIAHLLEEVVESVRHLARARGSDIQLHLETRELHAAGNRVMLRQALMNLLSHVVAVNQGPEVIVKLFRSTDTASVELSFHPEAAADPSQPKSPYAVAVHLLELQRTNWTQSQAEDGTVKWCIHMPLTREHSVLIVDDNEGLIALFKRYLRHHPYQVYAARSVEQAQEALHRLQPEAVILDVMMPERDGWELLQSLRTSDTGARPRVIVCSIIDDPKLAEALGADAFLNKPVDRASLLQVLGSVLGST